MKTLERLMIDHSLILWRTTCAGTLAALLVSPSAHALQPLSDFLDAGRSNNHDNREAAEIANVRSAEVLQAYGRLMPLFSARGAYTRNQHEVAITLPPAAPGEPPRSAVITPADQWDASFTVEIPLIDPVNWLRVSAAHAASESADTRALAVGLEAERQIALRYYQVLAAEGLVAAAERSLEAAEAGLKIAGLRTGAGAGIALDVERAHAEIERGRQNLADAELLRAVSRRALSTLTGLTPTPGADPLPDDDLRAEAPLAPWMRTNVDRLPAVRSAIAERKAADAIANAGAVGYIPVVSATATERISNAGGFTGENTSWSAGFVATWRGDLAGIGTIRALDAQSAAAVVREERARAQARDRIHDSWHQVRAQVAKSRAARAQAKAAEHASTLARDRYAGGEGTQLELLQAQRDAFAAEVQRIQADADLALARASLRLSAGKSIRRRGPRSARRAK
jgi:outer membrane protein TolC